MTDNTDYRSPRAPECLKNATNAGRICLSSDRDYVSVPRVWLTGFVLAICVWTAGSQHAAAETPCVIPAPVTMETRQGLFSISADTPVFAQGDAIPKAKQLIQFLKVATGFSLALDKEGTSEQPGIRLELSESLNTKLAAEGYRLEVTATGINLRAAKPAGLFYGIQTLRQLLPTEVFSTESSKQTKWTVPCVSITDYPRFSWRGLLIDPARHFIAVDDFKHYIDAMAMHKYNRLQVHFTDNQGWRIEIKKYPRLTEVGSKMDWNLLRKAGKGPRRFGFYTQDEIRELVRYAADRHVTIVPEIEMPYHAGAAIVAYPEHGVNTGHLSELPLAEQWKQSKGLIAPRPETVSFLKDILSEVLELFPSKFIHIGGDEAKIKVWSDDPEMQALMKELGCKDAHELHSRFIKQIDSFLASKGRRMIGWDEILQGGLAPEATLMSWRGIKGGITAAKAKHDVIMTPMAHTYFDYRQHAGEFGFGSGVVGLRKVYTFEPIPKELSSDEAKYVLGGQGQLWGEYIADRERRDYMTWPRACALIETLWSPAEKRDAKLFFSQLPLHLKRLTAADIGFRPLDDQPSSSKASD